jgi:colicin import membrane protein
MRSGRRKAEALRREEEAKNRAQQEALERQKAEEKKKLDAKQQETRARQQRETEAMRAQAGKRSRRAGPGRTRCAVPHAAVDTAREGRGRLDPQHPGQGPGQRYRAAGHGRQPGGDLRGRAAADGEIIDAQLRKSSGVRAYDDAVQRAILKSSPLPRPERADLFQRSLTLKFRPTD